MKKIIYVVAIIFIGYLIFNFFSTNEYTEKIKIGKKELKVDLVSSKIDREMGLSNRSGMCSDCGMLFIFEKRGIYPFWMKDMKFYIDIIWIDGNQIVKIEKDISYEGGREKLMNPKVMADKVLEINSGKSDEFGLKVGDLLEML